jgi:hypothetical protein
VRRQDELVTGIVRHGRLVPELTGELNGAAFIQRFGDGINPFAAALSFALIAIGEAFRQLVKEGCDLLQRQAERGGGGEGG